MINQFMKKANSILQLGVSPVAFTDKQAWLLAAQKALLALQVDALDDGKKEVAFNNCFFRLDEAGAIEELNQLMAEGLETDKALAEQLALNAALPWLLTFYSKQPGPQNDTNVGPTYCFPTRALLTLKPNETLFPLLSQHPRHEMAMALLNERFPSLTSLPTTPAVALVLIVVTARDVAEVTIWLFVSTLIPKLIQISLALDLCLSSSSAGTSVLVVDLFYHLATLLLALQQTLMLPPRHHYILQYALALHHASWNLDPTDTFKPRTVGRGAE